jgi:hypothetical protein
MKQRCGEERGGCYSVLLGLSGVNGERRRVDEGSRLGRRMIREEGEKERRRGFELEGLTSRVIQAFGRL